MQQIHKHLSLHTYVYIEMTLSADTVDIFASRAARISSADVDKDEVMEEEAAKEDPFGGMPSCNRVSLFLTWYMYLYM